MIDIYKIQLEGMVRNFKVVMLVGARQVGKSSLLAHLYPDLTHITFDPYNDQYELIAKVGDGGYKEAGISSRR